MSTLSLRLTDEESQLIKSYAKANGLNLSSFVRDLILDKIEDDLQLDTERILKASKQIGVEPAFDHAEVWERLGI